MRDILDLLNSGKTLSESQMAEAMTQIMDGLCSEDDIALFLTLLSKRGETVDEITGAAKILRARAETIEAPPGTLDCCGTGGDASGTYNVSTAVGLVVAACGISVAKHGNRAASSKSGAADVLETLGVNLDMPHKALERSLEKLNFCFLMAPHHHKAMKHVSAVRKKLGFKTIFNLLGPLANPAGADFQLVGVYDKKWLIPMAETLKNLGSKGAWVVHGSDGLDEITVTGATYVAALRDGNIIEKTIIPADFGLDISQSADLQGGDPAHNAKALREILNGKKSAYRDIVIANAAAALCLYGTISTLKEGAQLAGEVLDSGAANALLNEYISFSKGKKA
ncbi:MAG: anthranilate phosphoribosyltransferase [Alphaproteobacteria bacterium]